MPDAAHAFLTFLRSALSNPRRIGAVMPSSSGLARLMAHWVTLPADGVVLELGAGTGVVTRALLDAGVPRDRLYVVELDSRLHGFLQRRFPGLAVLQGDAADVATLLPPHLVGRVATVVSSLPVRAMPFAVQRAIVDGARAVLAADGQLIQYTYPPGCPLPARRLGLSAECLGRIWANVPPAAVWRFAPAHSDRI